MNETWYVCLEGSNTLAEFKKVFETQIKVNAQDWVNERPHLRTFHETTRLKPMQDVNPWKLSVLKDATIAFDIHDGAYVLHINASQAIDMLANLQGAISKSDEIRDSLKEMHCPVCKSQVIQSTSFVSKNWYYCQTCQVEWNLTKAG